MSIVFCFGYVNEPVSRKVLIASSYVLCWLKCSTYSLLYLIPTWFRPDAAARSPTAPGKFGIVDPSMSFGVLGSAWWSGVTTKSGYVHPARKVMSLEPLQDLIVLMPCAMEDTNLSGLRRLACHPSFSMIVMRCWSCCFATGQTMSQQTWR